MATADVKPDAVVAAERILGCAATAWTRVMSGGWSVNEHWIVELDDGKRAFLKHAAPVEPCPGWLRAEREVYAAVEGAFMPRLLGWEDGERPLLVLEDLSIGAHWPPPWRRGDVDAVLSALREVADAPVRAPLPRLVEPGLPAGRASRKIRSLFSGWDSSRPRGSNLHCRHSSRPGSGRP